MAVACLILGAVAPAQDVSGKEWWTPPGDVERSEFETRAELTIAHASLAWRTFIALNWPAVTKGAVPFFLRWSGDFINTEDHRNLLVTALRNARILLLDGHCSFVTLAHLMLDDDIVMEKIGSALTSWKKSLS